jgi:uncharacterized protein (TIGR03437 family)
MRVQLFVLSFLIVTACAAQNAAISAADQTLSADQTVVASLTLASAGQNIAALQFDLTWDLQLGLQLTAGDQLRAALKIPYTVSLGPQRMRCLLVGINQNVLADGELLKFFLSANSASTSGTAQVQITNAVATDPTGTAVALDATPINVRIQDGTGAPVLPATAVLNAASFSPGPLSPGEIITILGFNAPATASLRIDGSPAPILYVGPNQINAIVPFGLDLASAASLNLINQNQKLTLQLPVAPAAPAIFTTTGTGLGPGAILNEDYTPNSFDNPAHAGSIVIVYGTGFGTLRSPVTDGQEVVEANPSTIPVTATVAGLPATVLYVGGAPGLIAGVTQINLRLPASVIQNPTALLVLTVSGSTTPSGVTVTIQ